MFPRRVPRSPASRPSVPRRTWPFAVAAALACGGQGTPPPARTGDAAAATPAGAPPIAIRLLDRPEVVAVRETEDIPLSRLAVTADGRTDTLAGILVRHPPALLADSGVTGLEWAGPRVAQGFVWTRRDRAVVGVALPRDLPRGLPVARVAPDGRHLAYVAERGCGARHCATLVVVGWPDLRPVDRYDLTVAYGDHLDPRDRALWLDARRVAVELYDGRRGTRLVALVGVGDASLRVETQRIPPEPTPG